MLELPRQQLPLLTPVKVSLCLSESPEFLRRSFLLLRMTWGNRSDGWVCDAWRRDRSREEACNKPGAMAGLRWPSGEPPAGRHSRRVLPSRPQRAGLLVLALQFLPLYVRKFFLIFAKTIGAFLWMILVCKLHYKKLYVLLLRSFGSKVLSFSFQFLVYRRRT